MDRFVIRPSGPLVGEITVQGAKNSALKLMAASLLTEGTTRLENVPCITDVTTMTEVLEAIGASTGRDATGALFLTTPEHCVPVAPYELVEKMRASVVVLGPLQI